jgi:hypothetical protein
MGSLRLARFDVDQMRWYSRSNAKPTKSGDLIGPMLTLRFGQHFDGTDECGPMRLDAD